MAVEAWPELTELSLRGNPLWLGFGKWRVANEADFELPGAEPASRKLFERHRRLRLQVLDLSDCQLRCLPALPAQLLRLSCAENRLTSSKGVAASRRLQEDGSSDGLEMALKRLLRAPREVDLSMNQLTSTQQLERRGARVRNSRCPGCSWSSSTWTSHRISSAWPSRTALKGA